MKAYLKCQLLKKEIIKYGEFILKSGQHSPIYINLKELITYPNLLAGINQYLSAFISENVISNSKSNETSIYKLCGVPYGGIPIATGLSLITGISQILLRKEVKSYGTKKLIEGQYSRNNKIILIEDVITSGQSVRETIEILEKEGLEVIQVLSVVFRGTNKLEDEFRSKYNYNYIFHIKELLSIDNINLHLINNVNITKPKTKNQINNLTKTNVKCSNIFIALDKNYKLEDLKNIILENTNNIYGFKVHNEILGLTYEENIIFYNLCKEYNIQVWEDRKFNDIGNTINKQLKYYEHIRDIVSIVPTSGLESIVNLETNLKFLVLCEMSSKNNLFNSVLKNAVLDIVLLNPDKFYGIICQDLELIKICKHEYPQLFTVMPGINIEKIGDNKGQIYRDPRNFKNEEKPNGYVVGRGITSKSSFSQALEDYNTICY